MRTTGVYIGKIKENNVKSDFDKLKNTKKQIDYLFLITLFILLTLGAMMVYSAGYPYAISHYGDGGYYIKRQLLFLTIGLIFMFVSSNIPIELYKKSAPYFYFICVALLIIVLFGGFSEGVAKRWLGIPGTSLTFSHRSL